MSDQPLDNAALETSDSTPAPAAPKTGNQQEVDWQKRFAGLQGEYQKTRNQMTLLQAQLMEAQEALTRATGEREALALEHGQLKTSATQVTGELSTLKSENERLSILIAEYPALLPFYKDGLLPSGVGDEFRGKLKTFQERLSNIGAATQQQQIEQLKQGTPPPAPDAMNEKKPATLFSEAIAALRAGKTDEYDRLYSEYLKSK